MTLEKLSFDLKEVERLASLGLTKKQIAEGLGVCEETVYNRQNDNPEFKAAIKRGAAKGVAKAAKRLENMMENQNVTATIFYLKCRGGWKEEQKLEMSGSISVQPLDTLFENTNDAETTDTENIPAAHKESTV